jgi:hypothetical protein
MDGMDMLYGANRAVNGATFGGLDWLGNKLGIDTQMNEYLQLKDAQGQGNIARTTGQMVEYGSGGLSAGAIGKAAYEPANMAYNGYKIGNKYNKLLDNPFQGNGTDIIAKMKNHAGEPVVLQRGEAILGEHGNVITSGRPLQHITGTSRNYGLDKIIYNAYKLNDTKLFKNKLTNIIYKLESIKFGKNHQEKLIEKQEVQFEIKSKDQYNHAI